MNFKALLLVLSASLCTIQTWAGGTHPDPKHPKAICVVYAYAAPTTIEVSTNTTLQVFSNDTINTVSWTPAASVTSPTAISTTAHPTVTTTYTVTCSTSCGTLTDTVTVFVGCNVAGVVSTTPFYCAGSEGTASVLAYSGVSPYTYLWSNGKTTTSVTSLTAGSYTVTVKDADGCTSPDTFSIANTPASVIPYVTPKVIEAGDSSKIVAVQFYNGASTFAWSPSASVRKPTATPTYAYPATTTTYTVTMTNACGTFTDTTTLFIGCTLAANVTTTPFFCATDAGSAKAKLTGGVGPYTYSWSSGQTTSSISGLSAGTYSVTVLDHYGCSVTSSSAVASSADSVFASASSTSIEKGDSTNLKAMVNDTLSSSTFSWAPSASVTNPNSKSTYAHPTVTTTYTVSMTNACGTVTDTVTIFIGCTIAANVSTTDQYQCVAGKAAAYITNGVSPYTYSWSDGKTTSSITGLSAGSYSVTVQDFNGCSTMDTFSVAPTYLAVYATPATIEPGDSSFLYFYTNDTISAISWSPSASVRNPNAEFTFAKPAATTTYTVTFTAGPCVGLTDTVTVHVGCSLGLTVSSTLANCHSSGGTATANATNGVLPYSYSWSSGQTTSSVSGLSVGSYTVTVNDAHGCSASDTVSIVDAGLTVFASPSIIEVGDSTFLQVYSPDTLYTVSWAPSSSVTHPDSASTYAHPTTVTTYTVTTTNFCGTFTDTVTVHIGCNLIPTVVTTPYYCPANMGTASVSLSNGIAPYTYVWASGQTTSSVTGLNAGQDSVTIHDAHGCSVKDTFSVAQSAVNLSITESATIINVGDSTYLSAFVFDSLSGLAYPPSSYTIVWSPSSATYTDSLNTYAHPTATTTYTATVTTACGTITDTVTIDVNTFVGIRQISSSQNSLVISPNPGNGLFTLNYNLVKDENVKLTLVDEFGRTVYEKQYETIHAGTSKQSLDIENLAEGIYTLRMITNEGIVVRKVVILKK